ATTLADQADDADPGIRVARHHRQHRRLAHTGAREDAHALTAAARQERVDTADAQVQLAADPSPRMRRGWLAVDAVWGGARRQWPLAVDRLTECVEDTAQPAGMGIDHRVGDTHLHPTSQPDAFQAAERHQQGRTVPETDNLASDLAVAAAD